jgi:hypothetical protein
MAQPRSKIAEAFCGGDERKQGDARLRGDSVDSNSLLDPLTYADTDLRAPPQQRRVDEFAELSRAQSHAVAPLAPEGAFQPPQMAPGLKDFNIDHDPLRSGPIGDSVAIEPQVGARRLLLFQPSMASSDGGRSWPSARLGNYSAALNILASLGIFGVMALYLVDDPRQFSDFITMVPSSAEAIGEKPRLLVEVQKGMANEPLPLGVTVEHASEGATVTIEGLPDGADLSLGNHSDTRAWSVPAVDLEQTYVGPPPDFLGVIETIATLRAVNGRLLDRQALRFEWHGRKGDPPVTSPVDNGTASAGSAGAPSTSSSSLKPALAPQLAAPAGTANTIECQSSPSPYNKNHWAWRLIDNKKCWYAGERRMDKSKLHWAANADQAPEPAQRNASQPPKRIALPPADGPISGRN